MHTSVALATPAKSQLAYHDEILKKVSRTFALTIPQLPKPLRRVVINAYLLCRIADTIEDESALSVQQKEHFYELFLQVVSGTGDADAFASQLAPLLTHDALEAEKDLIRNSATIIAVMRTFSPRQQAVLIHCLTVMCAGKVGS